MNKPVAWMSTQDLNCVSDEYLQRYPFGGKEYFTIPLYNHPVKELTDEEIDKLAKRFGVVGLHEDAGLYEFVREILKNG